MLKGKTAALGAAGMGRIAAEALEGLLVERLGRLTPTVADIPRAVASGLLLRVDAAPERLALTLKAEAAPRWAVDPQGSLEGVCKRLRPDERLWLNDGEPARLRLLIGDRHGFAAGAPFMPIPKAGRLDRPAGATLR